MTQKRLPNDELAQIAEKKALDEIEKLNKLMGDFGVPKCNAIERAVLITYIKAKELGLLDGR